MGRGTTVVRSWQRFCLWPIKLEETTSLFLVSYFPCPQYWGVGSCLSRTFSLIPAAHLKSLYKEDILNILVIVSAIRCFPGHILLWSHTHAHTHTHSSTARVWLVIIIKKLLGVPCGRAIPVIAMSTPLARDCVFIWPFWPVTLRRGPYRSGVTTTGVARVRV